LNVYAFRIRQRDIQRRFLESGGGGAVFFFRNREKTFCTVLIELKKMYIAR
jgi:hypothetical protein